MTAGPAGRPWRQRYPAIFATVACLALLLAGGFAVSACGGGSGSDRGPAAEADTGDRATDPGRLRLEPVGRFEAPVEVRSAPGFPELVFVVEQPGRIMVLRDGRKLARPFLDLKSRVSYEGERGLLSVAFPPDYRASGRFYVYFTDHRGDLRLEEYERATPVRARPDSARPVLRIDHRENANHNGGQLHFLGPDLYLGTGDGGGVGDPAGNSQNPDSLLGKLIRIDPRRQQGRPYTVPADNPLVGQPGRDEIFAWGLRNPYRWSFDRDGDTVRIAIGDVGQSRFEEVNLLDLDDARGANFGWNHLEGFEVFTEPLDGTVEPSLVLSHEHGNCSVIGGVVVHNPDLPAVDGRYLFSDFCRGRILSAPARTGRIDGWEFTGLTVEKPSAFGTDAGGAVYVTSLDGPVYRIAQ